MLKSETFASNQQFINAWSYFASTCPEGEVLEANELVITWSGTDNFFINAVFFTESVRDEVELETKIKMAYDYAKKRNQPWWMIVAEDSIPEFLSPQLDEVFARQGLVPLLRMAGMATEQLLPSTRHSSKLNYVSVNNLEMRRAVADINVISSNLPLAPFREILETVFGTLGFVENQPVSTAITFLINDEFYLGLVATLPDYRNQGYAEAVIRHSLEQAEQRYGKKRTALHATPAGFPVYQRMGYQPTAYFRTYTC
ncbi:GNAT family N-acetyltransferase [Coleofasciculus sp. FACHB-SPT9]|uniref:GNAT family N-acetyltransferase n=1 Tax=Cyanophyceae TaxID=3028117 RepID=UPI00168382B7|nr:GNAT family N-acetyltransferase [Coleofasciculus sp. FACHB-SPT9]MBD1889859.1 GNAT family N-acetyltransferase [Coleofasciculus sp. FACHB-SPT9]